MARSDFNWVPINHSFTANAPTVTREFPIEGNLEPIDDAYLLITAHNIVNFNFRIYINNQELPSFDIPIESGGWQTWMDRIPPRFLQAGVNTIRIEGGSNGTVRDVVVNWRE